MYKKILLLTIITNLYGMEEIPLMTFVKPKTTEDHNECNVSNQNLQIIEHCWLTDISAIQLAAYTKLMLDNNILQHIPENFMALFSNLKEVDVSHNELTSIDIGNYFRACPNLKHMNFSYNKINDVTWSNHKSWNIEKDDTVILPIINLIGNPITDNNDVCNYLKERYCQALYQICHKIYPCSGITEIAGALSGLSASGLLSCILRGALHVNSTVWFSYIPGCFLGSITSIGCAKLNYYYTIKNRVENINIPIYFEENDQDSAIKCFSLESKSCEGRPDYLCKFNC